jgi:hypothetical protein
MSRVKRNGAEKNTDMESEILFMNRQKELRSLSRDFRAKMMNLRQNSRALSPQTTKPVADKNGPSVATLDGGNNDAELLLGEIEMLESETGEIVTLMGNAQFAKLPRAGAVKKQLHYLQTVNAGLRKRVEALLEVAQTAQ